MFIRAIAISQLWSIYPELLKTFETVLIKNIWYMIKMETINCLVEATDIFRFYHDTHNLVINVSIQITHP